MNELKKRIQEALGGHSLEVTKASVNRKGSQHGRPTNDYTIFIRDLLSGRLFKAEWSLAKDLAVSAADTVHLLADSIIKDIDDIRKNGELR